MAARARVAMDKAIRSLTRGVCVQESAAEFFEARAETEKAARARERLALTERRLAEALSQRTLLYPPPF